MHGHFDTLSLWCQQVSQYINDDRRELAGLNEKEEFCCQQLMADIKTHFDSSTEPLQLKIDQVNQWLSELPGIMIAAQAVAPSVAQNIEDELLLPLTGYLEELSTIKRQQHSKRSPSPPPNPFRSVGITKEKLLQAGLIQTQAEYYELGSLLPEYTLVHSNIIPNLGAFRKLQHYNPGLTLQHFAQLTVTWSMPEMRQWANRLLISSRSQTPYIHMMQGTREAIQTIGRAQHIPDHILEVVNLLNMDGLSATCLIDQLHTLSLLDHQFQGQCLNSGDMAYAINQNILTPGLIQQISSRHENAFGLAELRTRLQDEVNKRRDINAQRLQDYHTHGITIKTRQAYDLIPYAVPANDDSFYYAVGRLFAEPMGQVRRKCHEAAESVLGMALGRYQGDHSTAYAGRVVRAARTIDLKRLEQQVSEKILLTPAFERQDKLSARGTEDDLALVSIAYGMSMVPVSIDSGYTDLNGYYAHGEKYWGKDVSKPDAARYLSQKPGNGPLMAIYNGDHWDPLRQDN